MAGVLVALVMIDTFLTGYLLQRVRILDGTVKTTVEVMAGIDNAVDELIRESERRDGRATGAE